MMPQRGLCYQSPWARNLSSAAWQSLQPHACYKVYAQCPIFDVTYAQIKGGAQVHCTVHTLAVHTQAHCTLHTLAVHTLAVHTLAVHTLAVHTLAVHTLAVHTLAVHTLAVHTLAVHTLAVRDQARWSERIHVGLASVYMHQLWQGNVPIYCNTQHAYTNMANPKYTAGDQNEGPGQTKINDITQHCGLRA